MNKFNDPEQMFEYFQEQWQKEDMDLKKKIERRERDKNPTLKKKIGAARVSYWADLEEMPPQGPFIICGGPVGAEVGRIEQVRSPEGRGCPVVLHPKMRAFMKKNNISRGYAGACKLNELYHKGVFEWDDNYSIIPKESDL